MTQSNARSMLTTSTDPAARRWLDLDGIISKSLALSPGWATRAVEVAGNYGELFERNVGEQSGLKLERGLNNLWTHGGLMYSPPFQ